MFCNVCVWVCVCVCVCEQKNVCYWQKVYTTPYSPILQIDNIWCMFLEEYLLIVDTLSSHTR